jgi:hypothetical protein
VPHPARLVAAIIITKIVLIPRLFHSLCLKI